jgi:hypothetical protein
VVATAPGAPGAPGVLPAKAVAVPSAAERRK